MNRRTTVPILSICAFALLAPPPVFADYFGLEVVDRSDLTICQDTSESYIPYKMDVCDIHVVFDDAADRLISTAFSNVSTTAQQGFFQHTLGGNTAPACGQIALEPTLECDSFVTLGVDCFDLGDGSSTDPDFDSTGFNTSGEVSGGWFNSAPPNGQGDPDAKGRVMISRFSYKQNKNTSGDVCVFAQLGGSDDITAILLEPFDCAVPGGGLPLGPGDPPPGPVWFVDDDGVPTNGCCTSAAECVDWSDACPDLQLVLDNAELVSGHQIWVAEGTYVPSDCKESPPCHTGHSAESFLLLDGVSIYGGFPNGAGNPTFGDRDPEMFISELSGDLLNNDTPVDCDDDSDCSAFGKQCVNSQCILPLNSSENSYHVVVALNVDDTAVLDGFTVSGGAADGPSMGADPESKDQGSGLNIYYATPRIENCTFVGNESDNHGAVNAHGGATLTNCVVRGNYSGNLGAGLYIHLDVSVTATNCQFSNNNTAGEGGGAYIKGNINASVVTFTNCLFSENSALQGGGMYCASGSYPSLDTCTFSGNTTSAPFTGPNEGAGMYNDSSDPTITNCSFTNNICIGKGSGGGMYNKDASPAVTNCIFRGNQAPGTIGFVLGSTGCGGAMTNTGSSPMLTNCQFIDSLASYGGALYSQEDDEDPNNLIPSNPVLINCKFMGNHADIKGGGMFNTDASATTLTNCLFSGNSVGDGGGGALFNNGTDNSTTATNCTFSGNSTTGFGGGLRLEGSGADTFWRNCIFWGNVADSDADQGGPFTNQGAQIWGTNQIDLTYSDIEECVSLCSDPDDHNIGDLPEHEPKFIDDDGPDNVVGTDDDNLRLTAVIDPAPGSPCIDAGSNLEVPPDVADLDDDDDESERTPLDLDLNPRFVDDSLTDDTGVEDPGPPPIPEMVDMGAYEFNCPAQSAECLADLDADNQVGAFDLAELLGAWGLNPTHPADFNCDTMVGAFDLAQLLGSWGPCQ